MLELTGERQATHRKITRGRTRRLLRLALLTSLALQLVGIIFEVAKRVRMHARAYAIPARS